MSSSDYNARQRMTLKKLFFGLLLLGMVAAKLHGAAPETTWAAPSARLAKEIASISGPGTATLTIRNQSSLSNDEIAPIRRALEAQLRLNGVQLHSAENAAVAINVTLSENMQGWLWVAEVGQGGESKVALVPIAKPRSSSAPQGAPAMTLKKNFMFAQAVPILDFATIHAGTQSYLVVLDPANVSLYRSTGSKYELEQAFPVAHSGPFPRDVRGRVTLGRDHLFDAYLPGVVCASSVAAPVTVSCHESDDPWPVGSQKALYNSARDYFTGALLPGLGKPVSPFYTAAELPRSNYTLWIFTNVDGQVRESDGMWDRRVAVAGTADWGSDLAAVHDACGLGTQILVSASSKTSESLRAFEIADREPTLSAAPLEFDSPITALWTSTDGTTANVVTRSENGGRYEAYSVSVACGQ